MLMEKQIIFSNSLVKAIQMVSLKALMCEWWCQCIFCTMRNIKFPSMCDITILICKYNKLDCSKTKVIWIFVLFSNIRCCALRQKKKRKRRKMEKETNKIHKQRWQISRRKYVMHNNQGILKIKCSVNVWT